MIPIEDQVRWTIAAFMSNRDGTMRDIISLLRAAGIPRAHHACAMLLLAYGRHVLDTRGAHTSPMYVAREPKGVSTERRLLDDAFFAAARAIARDGSREEFELIGLIGGEMQAVMQAMREGCRPDELQLDAPFVDVDPEDAKPPHVELPDAHAAIQSRVGSRMSVDVRVVPHELIANRAILELVVEVRVGTRLLRDSIAAGGTSLAEAYRMALEDFEQGTLPVLIATLEGDKHARVVWNRVGGFHICSGPYLQRGGSCAVADLDAYFAELRSRLGGERLAAEPHWGHTYVVTNPDGRPYVSQMILDGKPWGPGDELARTNAWPACAPHGYIVRHFFVMLPGDDPQAR